MDTNQREIGSAIFANFTLPGEFLLSQISTSIPAAAAVFPTTDDDVRRLLVIAVSLVMWVSLAFAIRVALRLFRHVAWIVSTRLRIAHYRCSIAIGRIKSLLLSNVRKLVPMRNSDVTDMSQVEFDEIDTAVLMSASTAGQGLSISAPELADRLTSRPAEIQRSLDKLNSNKLLDYAFGSTDNYCLSQLGTSFVAMLRSRRQASA